MRFSSQELVNNYYHLTLDCPDIAKQALPGHYVIIEDKYACYIMGQNQGLEVIASPQLMTYLKDKQDINVSSLQGSPINPPEKNQSYLMVTEDDGLSALIFYLKKYRAQFKGLVLLGGTKAFPFAPCPSKLLMSGFPSNVIASIPLLEDWGIPNRLASNREMPGMYEGTVNDLVQLWLSQGNMGSVITITIPPLA